MGNIDACELLIWLIDQVGTRGALSIEPIPPVREILTQTGTWSQKFIFRSGIYVGLSCTYSERAL